MGFFYKTDTIPLPAALGKYCLQFACFALSPIAAALLPSSLPGIALIYGELFLLNSVAAMWPAAFKDVPVSSWLLVCVASFLVGTAHTILLAPNLD
jgi:hypothetical protein